MSWNDFIDVLMEILTTQTGFFALDIKMVVMWCIGFFFIYLAVAKKYEPLLLLPIGFGIVAVNFPHVPLMGMDAEGKRHLFEIFYHYGIEWEVIPCIIFMGLGAMTDFGPLIANPKTMIIGAGAQLGVFVTFLGVLFFGFTLKEAATVGIIGGADGPTTIYLTAKLAPDLLGANALAAYSYMAMVPLIQPPIVRLFSTKAHNYRGKPICVPRLRALAGPHLCRSSPLRNRGRSRRTPRSDPIYVFCAPLSPAPERSWPAWHWPFWPRSARVFSPFGLFSPLAGLCFWLPGFLPVPCEWR